MERVAGLAQGEALIGLGTTGRDSMEVFRSQVTNETVFPFQRSVLYRLTSPQSIALAYELGLNG